MSHLLNKPGFFRTLLSVSAIGSVLGVAWLLLTDQKTEQPLAVPATAALTRSADSDPVEFDAMFQNVSSGKCLEVYAYATVNDDPVSQWSCNNTANQRIWVDAIADSTAYRLRIQHSGKCLEPASSLQGAEVGQWVCHGGDYERPSVAANAQHWNISNLGNSKYKVVNVQSGMALTLIEADSDQEARFKLKPWTGASNQQFQFLSRNEHITDPSVVGSWGKLIAWPHVPVHAAVTPSNTVVTWASNELNDYPQSTGIKFSWSSVYDPASDSFLDTNNPAHDMFCAGTTLLEDGSLLASGGNPRASETSHFDPESNSWSLTSYMSQQRWYGTNVITGSGDVFTTFAKGAQETPELFTTKEGGWHDVPGADMSVLRDEQDLTNAVRGNSSAEMQWYSFMHTSPDGRIFQSGPTETMHWFDVEGQGTVEAAGTRLGESLNRQFGSAVMYDVGKLLVSGGSDPSIDSELSSDGREIRVGATSTAMTIDINGASPAVESVDPMLARRANHNAVVLPNGEVYVVGGTEWGLLFDDRYSVWWPEIWNPDSRQWRTVAALSTPRTYHSWALLLQDGRVLTGGGGLCGDCSANHPDAQIFSPPYLYNGNGQLATRPQIAQGTTEARVGGLLTFSTDKPVSKFSMIRLSSVTHSINNDQRFISLEAEALGSNLYVAQLNSNVNVMIPGMYWVFAIDSDGVPSEGHRVQVKSTSGLQVSLLENIIPVGGLQVRVGESISLQLPTGEFDQDNLVFSTVGLPQGLYLSSETGRLTGAFTQQGEGSFVVSAADGSVQATERLYYRVTSGSGSISAGGSFGLFFLFAMLGLTTIRRR